MGAERCSQAGMAVAWSIDHNPTAWNANHYNISNNDKNISVWIANDKEFIRVGDNYLGDGWKPEDYDRSLLWRAFQRWQQWKLRRDLQQSTAETTLDKP